MAELSRSNAADALNDGRLDYTSCARPAGPLVGVPQSGFTKVDGWVTNLFRDRAGRFYLRAVKGAQVEWLHVTVDDDATEAPHAE